MTALANSTILKNGELDMYSIKRAFAQIPLEQLKPIAQKLREQIDWYGHSFNDCSIMYNCIMEVIKISEPDFQTVFIPTI